MAENHKIVGAILAPMLLTYIIINVATTRPNDLLKGLSDEPEITTSIKSAKIDRKQALVNFFKKYNSPLENHVDTFIRVADSYNLDYRLLPAISCIESSCGKKLITDSYNPFGWGIYGNNVIRFKNFDEAIFKVGEGIHKNYVAKGFDTPEKIAPIYTPPSHKHWLSSVNYFMSQMADSIQ